MHNIDKYILRKSNTVYTTYSKIQTSHSITIAGTFVRATKLKEIVFRAVYAFSLITGKSIVLTKAHKSNATFHFRQKAILGFKLLLRSYNALNLLDTSLYAIVRKKDVTSIMLENSTQHIFARGLSTVNIFDIISVQYDVFIEEYGFNLLIKLPWCNKNIRQVLALKYQYTIL